METERFEVDEATAKILAEALEQAISIYEFERDEADKKLTVAANKLKELRRRFRLAGPPSSQPRRASGKGRLAKGEGDRLIDEFFQSRPGKAFTIAEIHKGLNMSFSSVRNILQRHPEKYDQESGGLWIKKA